MKKYILLISISILLLASCKKDIVFPEGSGPGGSFTPPTSTSLIAGKWSITASASTVDFGEGLIMDFDLYGLAQACQRDDFMTFNADGTLIGEGGANKCIANEPQILDTGKWSLSTDKKKLVINSAQQSALGISTLNCEVLELTEKKLVIRYITYLNGPKSTTTTSYTRIK